ncbi:DUF4937 domain-containing protein [Actinoplanes sp. NPDC051851]|uniref:DUF4937 domain-containing protein n=1 Tax=Actinoplanes sp. NPDC051851 TaxID=3154753 RepID=UPI00343F51AE
MLIKWVTCDVVDRAAFGRGQLEWAALRGLPGFLGQCGGWGRQRAHVFGFWADEGAYRAFMEGAHDHLAKAQSGTFGAIDVRLFDSVLDLGRGDGELIRLAHCHVREGRQEHFVRAQREVWNPGMTASPGMTGGAFGRHGDREFLVLSHWRSTADHRAYIRDRFMELRGRSGAATDLAEITGDLIDVVPEWTVRT